MDENKVKQNMKKTSEEYVIKVTSDNILDAYEAKQAKKRNRFINLKKLFIPTSAVLAGGLVLAIVLPIALNQNGSPTTPIYPGISGGDTVTDPVVIQESLDQNKVNKLAFEATTAVQTATNFDHVPVAMLKRAFSVNEKENIKEVLPSIDLILTNRSTFESTVVTSTREGFAYELTVSYLTVEEEQVSYSMYFNILKEHKEVEDDETETKILYKGVTTLGNTDYEFVAVSEEEVESDETESEIEMILYTNEDKTSYIQVEQEKESESGGENEESFEYKVYENRSLKKEFKIETEIEGFDTEIEVEINDEEYYVKLLEVEGKTVFKFSTDDDDDDDDDDEPVEYVAYEKVKITDPDTGKVTVTYNEITL